MSATKKYKRKLVPGYEKLADVLWEAYEQAAAGKGSERHADGKPFHDQPMQQIADRRGIGFILGQADKKSEEAQGMLDRGQIDAAKREILGAINYLAGAIIHIERHQPVKLPAEVKMPPATGLMLECFICRGHHKGLPCPQLRIGNNV